MNKKPFGVVKKGDKSAGYVTANFTFQAPDYIQFTPVQK